MQIELKKQAIVSASSDVLIVGIEEDQAIQGALKTLDEATKGYFDLKKAAGVWPTKAGQIRTFYGVTGVEAASVAVICFEASHKGLKKASETIIGYLRGHAIKTADIALVQAPIEGLSMTAKAQLMTQSMLDADYQFDAFKSQPEPREPIEVNLLSETETTAIATGIQTGHAIAAGMKVCKDLGNAPGNVCTPKYLAKVAGDIAKMFDSLTVHVLKERDIKELGMNALLSVSKGSAEKPRLITLAHQGADANEAPIVLVGKGVTFDTGGISIKPSANMDEMKYDMCGAATVIGVMKTVAMLNLPLNLVAVVPAVENMPSSKASKPGDIVTAMSGKTIEILNTDAEGRLILCDAMTYAQQTFKPKTMIDFATLTGAIIVALGHETTGIMANDDSLAQSLVAAGDRALDRAWHLPLGEEYSEKLKSPFADLQNISAGRGAGSLTAGAFLQAFVDDVPWAHLDIAGTAWQSGANKGATGRPVPLVVEYLLSQVS
ncbi:leucyl aminopeptidase [Ostreibacterium oceani]|uniref:Probable cytosol aminopeptidase n=1 Tax=Ostreibacterium oceani TaxID=2654998 RepID=A0A6N7EVS9_9GAMM|nr:leucyl aminopeptidase [Ostreibacterium oceani]MPV86602.1 leucyl aminopeptidase [Ostreibacterium oceani]